LTYNEEIRDIIYFAQKYMSTPQKDYTMPIIVIVGIYILTLLLNAATTPIKQKVKNVQPTVSPTAALVTEYYGSDHLYIIDQDPSTHIAVLSLSLKEKGFLVIKDVKTEEIVATSHLLDPGLYSGGKIVLQKQVTPGEKLSASIYIDNGDGKFEMPTSDGKDKTSADNQRDGTSEFTILGIVNKATI
jgi:hypothetical protein